MSREHARFTLSEGQVWVEDLGSKNGTIVGGIASRAPRSRWATRWCWGASWSGCRCSGRRGNRSGSWERRRSGARWPRSSRAPGSSAVGSP
ncbi:FHA domain-containing protein [Sorangium sp. So ce131]|uniref:FHA domain-containing protein n=1 Tax=Sorangium sp. So ce131 TaxID=3133282 RepID=UPI003F5E21D0